MDKILSNEQRKKRRVEFQINEDVYLKFKDAVYALDYDSVSQFLRKKAKEAIEEAERKAGSSKRENLKVEVEDEARGSN